MDSEKRGLKAVMSDPNLLQKMESVSLNEHQEARAKFEKKVQRLYHQLVIGCGDATCTVRMCRSNAKTQKLLPDAAAALAVQLASKNHKSMFCPRCPESPQTSREIKANQPMPFLESLLSSQVFSGIFKPKHRSLSMQQLYPEKERTLLSYLSQDLLKQTLDKLGTELTMEDHCFLEESIKYVFSNEQALALSFRPGNHSSGLNLESIEVVFNMFLQLSPKYKIVLCDALELRMAQIKNQSIDSKVRLSQLLIMLQNPLLDDEKCFENMFRPLLLAITKLNVRGKSILVQWLSEFNPYLFRKIVLKVQKYISGRVTSFSFDEGVVSAVLFLGMLYSSNEIMGIIDYKEFYNFKVSSTLKFKDEYKRWKLIQNKEFSFFNYAFLFDPIAKSRIVHIDAMVQMTQEYEEACVSQALLVHTQKILFSDLEINNHLEASFKHMTNPYLVLEVRRTHLVDDVVTQLHQKKSDLKKPLKVKFVNEDGMDQGGVQKEFFQEVLGQLTDVSLGMFLYEKETQCLWFNHASLEPLKQFELVGTIVGLAIYNGVIVSVRFPRLMYKLLLDEEINFRDTEDAWPTLCQGLRKLMEHDAELFSLTFEISIREYDVYKTKLLKPNGDELMVTNENKQEYINLYLEYLYKKAPQKQLDSFKKGLRRVCGGKTLLMFRAEELELLLCGQEADLDLNEIKQTCLYDGYTKEHQSIIDFWEIVMEMDKKQHKKLLEFVTASDRVPLKGLGSICFVIQRNGPDSDRLPTALTCFGRLLLPEYKTKEKTKRFLLTAIENAKGFGLI